MNKRDFLAHVTPDFIRFLDRAKIQLIQLADGRAFMPGGHNGPHFAFESPVRNSIHWLTAFSIGHRIEPSRGYDVAARALFGWLTLDNIFFRNSGFVFRQGAGDWCNGVIGYAWMIESLVRAADIVGPDAASLASRLYGRHQFNDRVGAWHRFDPHTGSNGIDFTLDHQAWFAAAAAEMGETMHVSRFLSSCADGAFRVRAGGRVNHVFHTTASVRGFALGVSFTVRNLRQRHSVDELELGYHHYTVLPFARMFTCMPGHDFFSSAALREALDFIGEKWIALVDHNKFAFPYNAPGFELPLLLATMEGHTRLNWRHMHAIYEAQMARVANPDRDMCDRGNSDPLTLTARIYELGLFIEHCLDEVAGGPATPRQYK